MRQTKLTNFRFTPDDLKDIAAIQKLLAGGGYSANATDAVRYALRFTAARGTTAAGSLRKDKVIA